MSTEDYYTYCPHGTHNPMGCGSCKPQRQIREERKRYRDALYRAGCLAPDQCGGAGSSKACVVCDALDGEEEEQGVPTILDVLGDHEERITILENNARKTNSHALEALRWLGRQRCKPSNCGSVCLCPPCHARRALETMDPEWNPR